MAFHSKHDRALRKFVPSLARLSYNPCEMRDRALPRGRTHCGTGAGALTLVEPLPPEAVARRPGFTRAERPRPQSPPADRWAAVQDHALAPSVSAGTASPTRNTFGPTDQHLAALVGGTAARLFHAAFLGEEIPSDRL
jgi:hypothetical protein